MKKSPSALFAMLSEQDESKRHRSARQSIDAIGRESRSGRTSEESREPVAGPEDIVETARQEASIGFDAALAEAAAADEDTAQSIEAVLSAMLGPLYVRRECLEILEEIGEGGFATVHLARLQHENGMSQMVAIKRLRAARLDSPEDLKEFIAEANLWRKLKSKDVVKLVGIGAASRNSMDAVRSSMYIVCEHMDGGTLRQAVEQQMMSAKKTAYTYSDVFRWFIGVSRAVKYLHSCSPPIVHRDLKPENVMLTALDRSTAEAKVLDLGLHMRNRATVTAADDEGSYYGGTMYDAAMQNGSVYHATLGLSLAEKVKKADAASADMSFSPPRTATRHNSTRAGNILRRIDEEKPVAIVNGQDSSVPAADEGTGKSTSTTASSVADRKGLSRSTRTSGTGNDKENGRNASHQSLLQLAAGSPQDVNHTSKVGSWMYMAPEMVDSHIYTEKVDVFSLSVMLFEALRGRLNVMRIAMGGDPEAVAAYAQKVASGHREALPKNWPLEVCSLIEHGWAQDPVERISASEFLARTSSIIDSGLAKHMDETVPARAYNGTMDCGCGTCAIM